MAVFDGVNVAVAVFVAVAVLLGALVAVGVDLRPGDVITARDKESSQKMVEQNVELNTGTHIPPWVSVDGKAKTATVVSMPKREDFPYPIVEQLIVECCSK